MNIIEAHRTSADELAGFFRDKLKGIVKMSGYRTDIGLHVFLGRRQIMPEHMPCVIMVEGDDRPLDDDGKGRSMPREAKLVMHYVFEGFDFGDADHPNDTGRAIVHDLKRAIFADDPVLKLKISAMRYAGRNIGVREDGTNIVSAYIEIDVEFVENLQDA